MALRNTLQGLVGDIDGALGCSVMDLTTGMTLAVHHSIPYFTQSFVDAAGAAAVEMFRGRNVGAVEKMLASQRGETPKFHTLEMQMTFDHVFHFLAIIPEKPNSLVILVTSRITNLGMGWSSLRMALPEIAAECPS